MIELTLKCVYYLLVFCRLINHIKNNQNLKVSTPKKNFSEKGKKMKKTVLTLMCMFAGQIANAEIIKVNRNGKLQLKSHLRFDYHVQL